MCACMRACVRACVCACVLEEALVSGLADREGAPSVAGRLTAALSWLVTVLANALWCARKGNNTAWFLKDGELELATI